MSTIAPHKGNDILKDRMTRFTLHCSALFISSFRDGHKLTLWRLSSLHCCCLQSKKKFLKGMVALCTPTLQTFSCSLCHILKVNVKNGNRFISEQTCVNEKNAQIKYTFFIHKKIIEYNYFWYHQGAVVLAARRNKSQMVLLFCTFLLDLGASLLFFSYGKNLEPYF